MLGILSNARSAACMTGRIGETMMPRSNYQAALESEIQRRLEADPQMLRTLKPEPMTAHQAGIYSVRQRQYRLR
jgi:hypothetical protein